MPKHSVPPSHSTPNHLTALQSISVGRRGSTADPQLPSGQSEKPRTLKSCPLSQLPSWVGPKEQGEAPGSRAGNHRRMHPLTRNVAIASAGGSGGGSSCGGPPGTLAEPQIRRAGPGERQAAGVQGDPPLPAPQHPRPWYCPCRPLLGSRHQARVGDLTLAHRGAVPPHTTGKRLRSMGMGVAAVRAMSPEHLPPPQTLSHRP